jgi:hypothetical protein
MKLYLASFMQPENFGPSGTLYSICNGNKPYNIKVDKKFVYFIPSEDLMNKYAELRPIDGKTAGELFCDTYNKQLQEFVDSLYYAAKEQNVSVIELLPFKDGDTLCSWERSQYTNYRKLLAPVLEKLGYEVILN